MLEKGRFGWSVRFYARVNLHVNVAERVWVRVGWAMALKILSLSRDAASLTRHLHNPIKG